MSEFDLSDDDDTTDVRIAPPPVVSVTKTLAHEALSAALTRRCYALLSRGACVLVIKTPSPDWVQVIAEGIPKYAKKAVIKTVAETSHTRKTETRAGVDALGHLQHGRSVVFVSPDPEATLDETVLAAADATVVIAPLTPALLRKVIRSVYKQNARGVTAEMAGLPVTSILSAIRPGLSARECVDNLRRALSKRGVPKGSSVPLLSDLPLTASLRSWTDRTLAELAAVSGGTLPPDRLVFGVLEGLPGTGKTLIAESLARTAGWSFVPSGVGSWFTHGDGALGGVARNVRSFVNDVLAAEPCVGFLDELDALPDRANMDNRSRDWWTPIITLLLIEIDRVRKSGKQVILLGGTNFFSRLDAALVRSGRLQQRITVLPPQTPQEVVAVLRFYLGDDLSQFDLGPLAEIGLGATPATIEGWVTMARAVARSENRALNGRDLLGQIVPVDDRQPADIRAIALHEVGHALVAHRLGHTVETVSIIASGSAAGYMRSTSGTMVPSMAHIRDTATVMLGGRAADIVLGAGANAGAAGDLEAATRLLLAAHERQGLGSEILFVPAVSAKPSAVTVSTVAADLQILLDRAIAMVAAEHDLALALADRLIEARVLSGAQVVDVLGGVPKPISGVQPAIHAPPSLRAS